MKVSKKFLITLIALTQLTLPVKAGGLIIGMPQAPHDSPLLGPEMTIYLRLPIQGRPNTLYSVFPASPILGEVPALIMTDNLGRGVGFASMRRQIGLFNSGQVVLFYYRGTPRPRGILVASRALIPVYIDPINPLSNIYLINNGDPVLVD